MAGYIVVKPNQSMSDVVLQATGTLNAAVQFCKDNGVSLSDVPVPGTEYILSDEALAAGNKNVLRYLQRNNIVIGTLNEEQHPLLNVRIILKPVLQHMPNTTDPPVMHAGMYDFDLKEAPGFINVYPIPHTGFPNPNCILNYSPYSDYTTSLTHFPGTGHHSSGYGSPFMTDKDVQYKLLWVVGTGHLLVWDSGMEGANTFTFRDVIGNEAEFSPFFVLNDAGQDVIAFMIPDINLEFLSSTASTCTVRITRSHPSSAYAEYATHNMYWTLDAIGGYADPDDPLNPDKRILVFPGSGFYKLGVKTAYTYLSYTWPASNMSMIIEVY